MGRSVRLFKSVRGLPVMTDSPANLAETACPSPAAEAMQPIPFRVIARREETHDTFTLDLQPADGGAPFEFRPGQFNMLYAFGVGESAISISGDASTPDTLVHTIRRVGTVTTALSRLQPGDLVGVRGPYGSAWPIEDAVGKDIVFIVGGIGLAPLRPAIYQALNQRERFNRVALLVGARTPADLLYHDELNEWRARADFDVGVTVDTAGPDWRGHVGVVTARIPKLKIDPANAVAMICGPEIMMRYTVEELARLGLSEDRIHVTMERNMKCAVGFCGHCQFGPEFICKNGPVFAYERIKHWFCQREI